MVKRDLQLKTTLFGVPLLQLRDVLMNNLKHTKDNYGYLLGGGFDLRLCDELFLRNEYTITYLRGGFPNDPTILLSRTGIFGRFDYRFKIVNSQYKIGLVYKFPVF